MDNVLQQQRPLSGEQRKILATMRVKIDLSPFEAEIIKVLRTITHGKLVVHMQDDIPVRVEENRSTMVIAGTDSYNTLLKLKNSLPS